MRPQSAECYIGSITLQGFSGSAEHGTESFLFTFVGVYRRSVGLFFYCVCVMSNNFTATWRMMRVMLSLLLSWFVKWLRLVSQIWGKASVSTFTFFLGPKSQSSSPNFRATVTNTPTPTPALMLYNFGRFRPRRRIRLWLQLSLVKKKLKVVFRINWIKWIQSQRWGLETHPSGFKARWNLKFCFLWPCPNTIREYFFFF